MAVRRLEAESSRSRLARPELWTGVGILVGYFFASAESGADQLHPRSDPDIVGLCATGDNARSSAIALEVVGSDKQDTEAVLRSKTVSDSGRHGILAEGH